MSIGHKHITGAGAMVAFATAGALTLNAAGGAAAAERIDTAATKTTVASSQQERGNSWHRLPAKASDRVSWGADGRTQSMTLPHESNARTVSKAGAVTVDGSAFDVDVTPTADGVRALITMANASAPKSYRFDVALPAGERLATAKDLTGLDTGEVFIVDAAGQVKGGVNAPWAKDANGAAVPTWFSVDGTTLVQHVKTNANTAFPVVADPDWWQIAKCAGSLIWLVGSTIFAAAKILRIKKYIAELGGFREAAELMLKASTWEERMRYGGGALVNLAAEISGVAGIRSNCFPN